jgi:hypothetical protein
VVYIENSMTRVEFNQGVPKGCVEWLWENVGCGNISYTHFDTKHRTPVEPHDEWFYERISKISEPQGLSSEIYCVPTITVKDPMKATLFVLRWGGR